MRTGFYPLLTFYHNFAFLSIVYWYFVAFEATFFTLVTQKSNPAFPRAPLISMQKARPTYRRRTIVRQRGRSRLKSRIIERKPPNILRWFSTLISILLSNLVDLELPFHVAFVLRERRKPKLVCDTGVLNTLYQEVLAEGVKNNQRRNDHKTTSISDCGLIKRLSCISQL